MDIREASIDDAYILFDWANDPLTRNNSFNTNTISWNDHILWYEKRLNNPNCKIYILQLKNEPIGVVRFDINKSVVIGLTIAPTHRGMGLGAKILRIACDCFWDYNNYSILAYIKKDNIASKHVFEKAGFTFIREDKVNNIECFIFKATKNVHR